MYRPTRATLAMGLCLVGVAGLVGRSFGQQGDPKVRAASNPTPAPAPAADASAARVAPKPVTIGSIDIDKVLKEYDKCKVLIDNLRAEALNRHNSLMSIATEAKQEQEKLQRMTPGSPDAKKCEDRITQLKAQFEAGRENAEREFSQKDAETMATIYNEIAAMTKGVAKSREMAFVVRYSDTLATGTEPNSVMAAMSRTIVFADPSVDITPAVIYWLNKRYQESGGPPPRNTSTAVPNGPTAQPRGSAPANRAPMIPGGN